MVPLCPTLVDSQASGPACRWWPGSMDCRPWMLSRPTLPRSRGLEDGLAALDTHLGDAERRAAALLNATRHLRRATK